MKRESSIDGYVIGLPSPAKFAVFLLLCLVVTTGAIRKHFQNSISIATHCGVHEGGGCVIRSTMEFTDYNDFDDGG
jgi:hypothetical protein